MVKTQVGKKTFTDGYGNTETISRWTGLGPVPEADESTAGPRFQPISVWTPDARPHDADYDRKVKEIDDEHNPVDALNLVARMRPTYHTDLYNGDGTTRTPEEKTQRGYGNAVDSLEWRKSWDKAHR